MSIQFSPVHYYSLRKIIQETSKTQGKTSFFKSVAQGLGTSTQQKIELTVIQISLKKRQNFFLLTKLPLFLPLFSRQGTDRLQSRCEPSDVNVNKLPYHCGEEDYCGEEAYYGKEASWQP